MAANWIDRSIKKFGKEAVENILSSKGLSGALNNGAADLTSATKSSITRELNATIRNAGENVTQKMSKSAQKAQASAVSDVIERFGPEQSSAILQEAKNSGKPIQEVAENFSQNTPNPNYQSATGRKDIIDSSSPPNSSWKRKNENTGLMSPEDIERMHNNESIFNDSSYNAKQKEYQTLFDNENSQPMSKGEFNYRYNEDGTLKTAEQRQEYMRKLHEQQVGESATVEKHRSVDEVKQSAKEKYDKKKQAEIDEVMNRAKDSKETGSDSTREAYERKERAAQFEEMKDRSVLGTAAHKTGNGLSWLFGSQQVRTDASGAVTNSFGARKQLRKNYNDYIGQAFIAGQIDSPSAFTKQQFKSDYGAIKYDTMGNFKNSAPITSSDFSGITNWMKEHQLATAGIIAATGVGVGGLMSRNRDGD